MTGAERPQPIVALHRALAESEVELPEELLSAVLDLEAQSDPDATSEVRQARLRRLLEQAAGARTET